MIDKVKVEGERDLGQEVWLEVSQAVLMASRQTVLNTECFPEIELVMYRTKGILFDAWLLNDLIDVVAGSKSAS